MGLFGVLHPFFPQISQEWAKFGLSDLGFFPSGSQKWVIVGFRAWFPPGTLRNGWIWVSGPLFPQSAQQWAPFGPQGLFFFPPKAPGMGKIWFLGLFLPQNSEIESIWASGPLRFLHSNPQKWIKMGVLGPFFLPKTHRNGQIWLHGLFYFFPSEHTGLDKRGL